MSDKSSLDQRLLRQEEVELLRAMLERHNSRAVLLVSIDEKFVRDLQDGGMGSVEFSSDEPASNRRAECIVEADYMDSDGTPVSIAVNVDQNGNLFELDIWKVDFNHLQTFPTAQTIRNIRHSK